MADSKFNVSVKELLDGLDSCVSTKTVTGEPITVNDTVIIPFMDVSLGVGAGSFGGGLGSKLTPSAVLVISGNTSKLISIKNQETALRVLDMVPEVLERLKAMRKKNDPAVDEAIEKIAEGEPVEAPEAPAEAAETPEE